MYHSNQPWGRCWKWPSIQIRLYLGHLLIKQAHRDARQRQAKFRLTKIASSTLRNIRQTNHLEPLFSNIYFINYFNSKKETRNFYNIVIIYQIIDFIRNTEVHLQYLVYLPVIVPVMQESAIKIIADRTRDPLRYHFFRRWSHNQSIL